MWTQERAKHIAAHVLMAAQQDLVSFGARDAAASYEVGRAYNLQCHGVPTAINVDFVARTWDSINAIANRIPATPRAYAEPTHGPCVRGHVSTARHGGRLPWWHRVVDGLDTDLNPGDAICHACYLALRKLAREVARASAAENRPPDSPVR